MPEIEARYPCPVCLGVKLEKIRFENRPDPWELDHCGRCGGVWFELGEVQRLRSVDPRNLWDRIARREGVHQMLCHSCQTALPRSELSCHACGWSVALDCPVCARPMKHESHGELHLDVCRWCKGVWFDHNELATIWKLEALELVAARQSKVGGVAGGSVYLLEALTYDPFAMHYGAHLAGHAIGGAAQILAHTPEAIAAAPGAIAGAAEAAGEVAGSVFETIFEIISGLFG